MPTRRFVFSPGVVIDVDAPEDVMALALDYIAPHSRSTSESGIPDWRVRVVYSEAPPHARLGQAWASCLTAVEGLRGFEDQAFPEVTWLRDESQPIWQRWHVESQLVEVRLTKSVEPYSAAQSTYAAVRLAAAITLRTTRPSAIVHAAAVRYPEGVFLICGPKGAGKTVATLALLEAGAEFISSDRAFLFRGRRSWRCTGWMASVRVAPDALSLVLPPVRSRGLKAYASQRTNQQAFHFAGKFRYPPRALLALGGWRSVPDGPLAAVVELESLAEPRERAVRARAADILKRHAIDVPLVDHLAKRAPMVAEYDDLDVPAARLTGRLGPSGLVRMFRAILTNHDRDIPFLES